MDTHAGEVWKHAPAILEKLQGALHEPREKGKNELLKFLGFPSVTGEVVAVEKDKIRPSHEEYECALHTAIMDRLESGGAKQITEVADMLDVTAFVVTEFFLRAAQPGMPATETDRCKNWWSMLLSVAEDVSRLVPIQSLERFVSDWETSLVKLSDAYLKLAKQRLSEFDARQEADQRAAEEQASEAKGENASRDAGDAKAVREQRARELRDSKEKETKRTEERKKMISMLSISPNGQLYLSPTSLLKQLCSRLCSSLHASLRARIVLLLERLLAMDHKAIANNQKLKTTEYIQLVDLDCDAEKFFISNNGSKLPIQEKNDTQAGDAAPNAVKSEGTGAQDVAHADKSADSAANGQQGPTVNKGIALPTLGNDPAVDFQFYRVFWGLQEALQHPERLFDSREGWPQFHNALSRIVKLFQKHPMQEDAKPMWSPPEPAPLRHAPSARALAVQLDDPGFRQQFLTQVLIAFQALEQDASSRRGDSGGLISRQPEAVVTEFTTLKRLCESTLEQTRRGFQPLLRHMLDRESHWVSWKGHGCREFERESLEMLSARIPPADKMQENPAPMRASKPQLAGHLSSLLKTLKDPQWNVPSTSSSNQTMRTHAMRKMCDTYLDRLIEEEKPENQIEEEYRAKRNKVFMWQCRRLFGHQYLRFYAQKDVSTKTDFMDYVRAVRGKPLSTTQAAGQAAAGDFGAGSSGVAATHPDGCVEDSPPDPPADIVDPPGTAAAADAVTAGSVAVNTSTPADVAAAAASATPAELAAAAASAADAAAAAPVPANPTEPVLTIDESSTPTAPATIDPASAGAASSHVACVSKRELAAVGAAVSATSVVEDIDAHRDKKAKH
mmetsp:Transcript_15166/g.29262  ORF Transcript_15166/g.29262 Transcript_15166/m.29262 type:complete len:844 (+) Transcript_15166:94-2625(+)